MPDYICKAASGPISDATEQQLRHDMPLPNSGGVLKNFAAGTIDAFSSLPGFVADLGVGQANAESGYTMLPDKVGPVPQPSSMITPAVNRQLGKVGLNPDSVTANTYPERIARAAGYGAAAVAAPEAGLSKGASVAAKLLRATKAATIGAGAGATGEIASDAVPDPYKPVARLVGNAVGGGVTALAERVPQMVGSGAGAVARNVGPISEAGAQRMAADRLTASATNPDAARTALANVQEYVPGSKPTTGQASSDMGLLALEREVQTKNPAEFAQRRSDQNAARLGVMNSLQPEGSPGDLPDYIRGQMRWLDQQTDQDVADATQLAQQRADTLGGTQAPEHYGAQLRVAAQDAADSARARERALWRAVDPNGDLTVNAAPIRNAAQEIANSVSSSAKPITGDERNILDVAQGYGPTAPFRDIGDLRSYVSDAMRTELRTNGQTQTYGRLSRLRGAIEGAINAAVEQRAQDAPQVLQDGITRFEQWITREAAQRQGTGAGSRASGSANVAFGTGGISSGYRAQGAGGGQSPLPSGNPSVQSQPTFDEAARERLSAATAATRERADTFNRGPVGQVLAKAGRQDQYRLSDAAVPAKIFQPGPTGFESVQSYRNAVGDGSAFLTLQDYAASALRQYAGRPDGTLDPAKVQAWTARHADALRAFPELAQRFRDAATASDVIGDAMAARRNALDAYQTGVFGKVIGVSNPEDVTRTLGGILNSRARVQQMQQLASVARRDPNAMAGLRKGVADYIRNRFVGNTEAATSGQGTIKADAFQTFMREQEPALATVFSPDEIASMKAIAADLQRANRSLSAVKIPGQSNTAQDLAALQRGQPSILGRLITEGVGALGGELVARSPLLGWLGAKTIGALRDAGMKRVDDVLREAMLNPEVARALLEKAPAAPDTGSAIRLRDAIRRAALIGAGAGAAKTATSRQSRPLIPTGNSYADSVLKAAQPSERGPARGYAGAISDFASPGASP